MSNLTDEERALFNTSIKQHTESAAFYREKGEAFETTQNEIKESVEATENDLSEKVDTFIEGAEGTLKYLHDLEDIDLRGDDYSTQLFYPVLLPLVSGYSNKFEIFKAYHAGLRTGGDDPLGLCGLSLLLEATGGTWGGNPMDVNVEKCVQTYFPTLAAAGIMHYGLRIGFFLRGGGLYRIKGLKPGVVPSYTSGHRANYNNNGAQYKLDCGPVDYATAQESNGALSNNEHFSPKGSCYINSLGGNNQGYYT